MKRELSIIEIGSTRICDLLYSYIKTKLRLHFRLYKFKLTTMKGDVVKR